MAFGPAVFAAVEYLFPKALTPKWLSALSERMYIPVIGRMVRDANHAYEALKLHMGELVSLSRAWVVEGKVSNMDAALLRNLVEANMEDEDAAANSYKNLTDDELFSNTFVCHILICIRISSTQDLVVSSGRAWYACYLLHIQTALTPDQKRVLTRWRSRSHIWLYILTYNRKYTTKRSCCGLTVLLKLRPLR
jgi:hypothetical protein